MLTRPEMEKVFASLVYIRPPVTPVLRPRFGLEKPFTGYPDVVIAEG